tara:strand:+ start:538 stop:1137 length:600 start_codon:yes stop_codon:yes gene_type:complete
MAVVYTHNIKIDTGSDYEQEYSMFEMGGKPVDLTNFKASAQLRRHPGSDTAISFDVAFVDRAIGKIQLAIPNWVTSKLKSGRYVYDIIFTRPTGKKEMVLQGSAIVVKGISQGCSFSLPTSARRLCIAISDGSSQTRESMSEKWKQFRLSYPNRIFYLLMPSETPGDQFGTQVDEDDFLTMKCPDNFLSETTINEPPLI